MPISYAKWVEEIKGKKNRFNHVYIVLFILLVLPMGLHFDTLSFFIFAIKLWHLGPIV